MNPDRDDDLTLTVASARDCPLIVVVDANGVMRMSSNLADPADVLALLDQVRATAANRKPERR